LRLGVLANTELPQARQLVHEASRLLLPGDQMEQKTASVLGKKGVKLQQMDVDILIVIGGDGTMLKTFMSCDLPLIGVNAGNVGFLTEIDGRRLKEVVHRLRKGRYVVEEALKLRTEVNGRRVADAVNEAVIHSANIGKVRHFIISVDGKNAGLVRADGIIVSTPTGSTSYSLAAGGPIVDPSAQVLVLTPIAPYGISSRPIVCSPDVEVRISIEGERKCKLVIDGQYSSDLSGKEEIILSGSENRAKFVRLRRNFYERVHSKLIG